MGVAIYTDKEKGINIRMHFDDVFEFKGFRFTYSLSPCFSPPIQLKKNGEPRKENTKAFWEIWEDFYLLPKEEQKTYMIEEE